MGLPLAAYAARLDSTVAGVHLGTITYSFRDLPRIPGKDNVDDLIKAITACGIGEIELYNLNIEPAPSSAAKPASSGPADGVARTAPAGPTPEQLAIRKAEREALRKWRLETPASYYQGIRKNAAYRGQHPYPSRDDLTYDGTYLVDKLTDVYHSGTKHEEKQPAHLHIADREICATTCATEYGNPCTRFCPAQVYNMLPNEKTHRLEMQVDFSNCVHCKTCDIRDPYQIITWVPPEGGGGPEYGIL